MIAFFEKLLFKEKKVKQFIAVRITGGCIREKVIIKKGDKISDVTQRHSIISQTPFCVSICLDNEEAKSIIKDYLQMHIVKGEKTISSFSLKHIHTINLAANVIGVFEIVRLHNYQLNFIQREFLLRFSFLNKKTTYFERKAYAGLYSFPRNIIVVSYTEKDYANIFPMDFQCYVPEANIYLLGLRTSNTTLEKISKSRRLVVSDTALADLNIIYSLGSHHAKALNIKELPFGLIETEQYKFSIPDFSTEYKELELLEFYQCGSHMLLIGKSINSKKIRIADSSLYHVHFFQLINSTYPIA